MRQKMLQNRAGYTLVELLAQLALSMVVLSLLTRFIFALFDSYHHLNSRTEVMQNLRIGMDFVMRDLNGCRAITRVTPSTINLVAADGSTIRYHANNQVFYRTLNGVVNPVVMGVKELRVREVDSRLLEVVLSGEAEGHEYSLVRRVSIPKK